MGELHRGIVLRANSAYKSSITLLDEQLGKIESFFAYKTGQARIFHGALISYSLKKRHAHYVLSDTRLVDMPDYLMREHFLFFHHILELCDYFFSVGSASDTSFRVAFCFVY